MGNDGYLTLEVRDKQPNNQGGERMSAVGWVVIAALGLYGLAVVGLACYLGPQLIRERIRRKRREAVKNE